MRKKMARAVAGILAAVMILSGQAIGNVVAAEEPGTSEEQVMEELDVNSEDVQTSELTEENEGKGTVQDEETVEEQSKINYVYIEKSYVESETEQNIVVSLGEGNEDIDTMDLLYIDQDGNTHTITNSVKSEELYLFSKVFDNSEAGVYQLKEVHFTESGQKKTVAFDENDMQIYFGVDQEYNGESPASI